MSKSKRRQQVAIDLDTAQFRRQKAAREALWAVVLGEEPWFDHETGLWTIEKSGYKITDTSPERVMIAFEEWMKQTKKEACCDAQKNPSTTPQQDGNAGEVPQI